MTFKLSARSKKNLSGVHPDLVRVVEKAITLTIVDFVVIEGVRTKERQKALLAQGASQTLNSRHITGHAVDLAAWVGGALSWKELYYSDIADAMFKAASEFDIPLEWGGRWITFKDYVHFQLPRRQYA